MNSPEMDARATTVAPVPPGTVRDESAAENAIESETDKVESATDKVESAADGPPAHHGPVRDETDERDEIATAAVAAAGAAAKTFTNSAFGYANKLHARPPAEYILILLFVQVYGLEKSTTPDQLHEFAEMREQKLCLQVRGVQFQSDKDDQKLA